MHPTRAARRCLVVPTTLSIAILSSSCSPPAPGPSDAQHDVVADAAPPADAPAGDVAANDGAAPCADANALPRDGDLGCWTCDPPATDSFTPVPPMPGVRCGTCRNPFATVQPRGGCGQCAADDGGAPYIYC